MATTGRTPPVATTHRNLERVPSRGGPVSVAANVMATAALAATGIGLGAAAGVAALPGPHHVATPAQQVKAHLALAALPVRLAALAAPTPGPEPEPTPVPGPGRDADVKVNASSVQTGSARPPSAGPQAPTPSESSTDPSAPAEPGLPGSAGPGGAAPPPPGPSGPVGAGTSGSPGGSGVGSWWDSIPGLVGNAINAWMGSLVFGIVLPATQLVGQLLNPNRLTGAGLIHQLWSDSRAVADSLYVLLVLAGGVIVAGHESVQTRYGVKQIAPRLVWGFLAANLSWLAITQLTALAGAIALTIAGSGVAPAQVLAQITANLLPGGLIAMTLLIGVVAVMALLLAIELIVLGAVLLVLTVAAPLCLAAHALPQTEAIAWLWWRTFAAILCIPTVQAIILALISRILLSPDGQGFSLLGLTGTSPGGVGGGG